MVCQLQKDLLLRTPNFFISFSLQQLSESFYKIKIADSIFKIPKSNVQNPFNLKVVERKTFSFSALYKFRNVLIVYYYVMYFKFYLYFTLAKEEHKA